MDYNTEKQMLVDIARASIEANGPWMADEHAPVLSLVYCGETNDEMILDLFIGEDSGQVLVNSAPYCNEELHEFTLLADFSNEEMRAILEATGLVTDYKHFFSVHWDFRSSRTVRHYSRDFDTLEEALKKAQEVDKKSGYTSAIQVSEEVTWNTPDPAPNGTFHGKVLEWNIPWKEV
jgi:hypothetical protein